MRQRGRGYFPIRPCLIFSIASRRLSASVVVSKVLSAARPSRFASFRASSTSRAAPEQPSRPTSAAVRRGQRGRGLPGINIRSTIGRIRQIDTGPGPGNSSEAVRAEHTTARLNTRTRTAEETPNRILACRNTTSSGRSSVDKPPAPRRPRQCRRSTVLAFVHSCPAVYSERRLTGNGSRGRFLLTSEISVLDCGISSLAATLGRRDSRCRKFVNRAFSLRAGPPLLLPSRVRIPSVSGRLRRRPSSEWSEQPCDDETLQCLSPLPALRHWRAHRVPRPAIGAAVASSVRGIIISRVTLLALSRGARPPLSAR